MITRFILQAYPEDKQPVRVHAWIARRELLGVATFIVIGVALIALAPAKQPVERASPVAA
jgi:hypothetical protein